MGVLDDSGFMAKASSQLWTTPTWKDNLHWCRVVVKLHRQSYEEVGLKLS
jgi:hypothetical protein